MPSHHTSVLLPALALVLSLGLSACGEDKEPTTTPTPSGTPTVIVTGPGSDKAENLNTGTVFIEALVANTAESLATARSLTAPKSGAARYVADLQEELPQGAKPLTSSEPAAGEYRLCAGEDCIVLTGLVLADGKISSFKVDGKQVR